MAGTPLNQSLQHGLQMLSEVLRADAPVGVRELGRRTGFPPAKAARLLATLTELGLVQRMTGSRCAPGPRLHLLAAQALHGTGLVAAAMPQLRALRAPGRTVALGVLWADEVCFLVHARPGQRLSDGIGTHALHPAGESSLGLVLQAYAPDATVDPARTRRRHDGLARLDFPNGEISLAVPIGVPPVAAIGVSQSGADPAEITRELRQAAAAIATSVGCVQPLH
jgi:DNA-binding IclR family transcriptional regulator